MSLQDDVSAAIESSKARGNEQADKSADAPVTGAIIVQMQGWMRGIEDALALIAARLDGTSEPTAAALLPDDPANMTPEERAALKRRVVALLESHEQSA